MDTLTPFGPAAGMTMAELSIETDEDSLVLSGSLQISLDQTGLHRAERLAALFTAAVAHLQAQELPATAAAAPSSPVGPNPFS